MIYVSSYSFNNEYQTSEAHMKLSTVWNMNAEEKQRLSLPLPFHSKPIQKNHTPPIFCPICFIYCGQKTERWFDWTQMWCLRLLHTSKACLTFFSCPPPTKFSPLFLLVCQEAPSLTTYRRLQGLEKLILQVVRLSFHSFFLELRLKLICKVFCAIPEV